MEDGYIILLSCPLFLFLFSDLNCIQSNSHPVIKLHSFLRPNPRYQTFKMHLFTPLLSLLFLTATTLAVPTGSDPFQFLSVSLQLSGGPASYILNLQADGNTYYTSMHISPPPHIPHIIPNQNIIQSKTNIPHPRQPTIHLPNNPSLPLKLQHLLQMQHLHVGPKIHLFHCWWGRGSGFGAAASGVWDCLSAY